MVQLTCTTQLSCIKGFEVPEDIEEFLSQLTDCSYIDVVGKDTSRTRVISVLIHGSEPSGFIGMHRWLLTNCTPQVNLRFIIASVSAAQKAPIFTHRYLPDEQDLNRCFSGCDDPVLSYRAESIMELINQCDCEMIVDLHNTSAPSSAYSISLFDSADYLAISSYFSKSMVLTKLKVGSLLEQNLGYPFVAIECGAPDDTAHDLAYEGIKALANAEDFRQGYNYQPVKVLSNPSRVEIEKQATLAFLEQNDKAFDVVLKADIESHNMKVVPKGYCFGWVNSDKSPLLVQDEFGLAISNEALSVVNGCLIANHNLQIFMATTNVSMAKDDCMFYIINLGN